jgi:uncharacterized protein (TIGR03067 family)
MNALLIVVLVIAAPGVKDPPKKAEPPAIVGEWECIELIGGGRKATAAELAKVRCHYEFTSDGKLRSEFGGSTTEGTYTTAPTREPAEIDMVSDRTGKKGAAIYRVDKDLLIICGAEGGGARPTKFESLNGTRVMLMTFKRVEKKKE